MNFFPLLRLSTLSLCLAALSACTPQDAKNAPPKPGNPSTDASAPEYGGMREEGKPYVVGQEPKNPGELVLWTNPDKSFTVMLPSAARCTDRTSQTGDKLRLCAAAGRDSLVLIYSTDFSPSLLSDEVMRLNMLDSAARQQVQDTDPLAAAGAVTDVQIVTLGQNSARRTTSTAGNSVFLSLVFFHKNTLYRVTATPNPKSDKGVVVTKNVIDSIQYIAK